MICIIVLTPPLLNSGSYSMDSFWVAEQLTFSFILEKRPVLSMWNFLPFCTLAWLLLQKPLAIPFRFLIKKFEIFDSFDFSNLNRFNCINIIWC